MMFKHLVIRHNKSLYSIANESDVPYTTVSDLFHQKTKIENMTAKNVYKLSRSFNMSMDAFYKRCQTSLLDRSFDLDYDQFRSDVAHVLKHVGDLEFMKMMEYHDWIRCCLIEKKYVYALYMLSLYDYLKNKMGQPLDKKYERLRSLKLKEPLYPADSYALEAVSPLHASKLKEYQIEHAYPEFLKHNIVEGDLYNVV